MIQFKEDRFCKHEKHYVDYVVLKNLCRVLKNRKLFAQFRCTIGIATNSKMSFAYRLGKRAMERSISTNYSHNPFKKCSSMEEILNILDDSSHNHADFRDDMSVQRRVIDSLNTLMHVLLERTVGDIRMIESIGEETFNNTCKELFNGEFKDLTVPPDVDMDLIRRIGDMMRNGEQPNLSEEERRQIEKFVNFTRQQAMQNPMEEPEEFMDEEFIDDEDEGDADEDWV